jgi:hypothetical protein
MEHKFTAAHWTDWTPGSRHGKASPPGMIIPLLVDLKFNYCFTYLFCLAFLASFFLVRRVLCDGCIQRHTESKLVLVCQH